MSSEDDCVANDAYIAYVQEQGNHPSNVKHLLYFGKSHVPPFIGLKYVALKRIMKNRPSVNPLQDPIDQTPSTDFMRPHRAPVSVPQHINPYPAKGSKIRRLTETLLNQNLNIKQTPTIQQKKEFICGDADAKPIKTIFKILSELEDLDEKYELIPQSDTASLVQIDDTKHIKHGLNQYAESMKITHKINLITPNQVLEKNSLHDDRFNIDIIPLSSNPVLSLYIKRPFTAWTQELQDEFMSDVAAYLEIQPSQLTDICVSKGSIEFFLQLCSSINQQFPEINKKIVSWVNDIDNRYIKKWKLKKTEIKNFFCQKFSRSTSNNIQNVELGVLQKQNDEKDTLLSAEKWLLNQAQHLRENIHQSLQECASEYEISAICALDNNQCLEDFVQIDGWKESKLLYHGTKLDNLGSIFDGFNDAYISKNTGNDGWYGKGHYFTSYPAYAMDYIASRNPSDGNQYTLIIAYVNLGKTKNIYDQTYLGKDIQHPFQSHYAKVKGCYAIPQSQWGSSNSDIYDEYVVCTGKRVLPRFYVTFTLKKKVLVWRDSKLQNAFNSGVMDILRKSYVVYGATSTADALKVIKRKKDKNEVYVITNGADQSEQFIAKVRYELNVQNAIFIFSATRDEWGHVYSKYTNVDYTSEILDFIKKHII